VRCCHDGMRMASSYLSKHFKVNLSASDSSMVLIREAIFIFLFEVVVLNCSPKFFVAFVIAGTRQYDC